MTKINIPLKKQKKPGYYARLIIYVNFYSNFSDVYPAQSSPFQKVCLDLFSPLYLCYTTYNKKN